MATSSATDDGWEPITQPKADDGWEPIARADDGWEPITQPQASEQRMRSGIGEAGATLARETLKILPNVATGLAASMKPLTIVPDAIMRMAGQKPVTDPLQQAGAAGRAAADAVLPADPARTGFGEQLLTQTLPGAVPAIVTAVATKNPRLAMGALGVSGGIAQGQDEAKALNLGPVRGAALELSKGALGALDAAGGVGKKLAQGVAMGLGKTVAEEAGISAAQVVGGNLASRQIGGDKSREYTEGLGQALAASVIVPGGIHTVQAGMKKPAALSQQDLVKWAETTHPGRHITLPQANAVRLEMLDGNQIEMRLQPEVSYTDADAPEFMRTMRAQFPQETAAAVAQAQGDELAAARVLRQEFGPQGRTRSEPVVVGEDGQPVRVRKILELASGEATPGTLAEEEFHALVRLAGADEATIKRLGGSEDLAQAEENMAAQLKAAGDNAAKGFIRRFAERLFGRQRIDEAVVQYRDALRQQVSEREAPTPQSRFQDPNARPVAEPPSGTAPKFAEGTQQPLPFEQQAVPEPEQGTQREVGSRFQDPNARPVAEPPSGTAPKFAEGTQQPLPFAQQAVPDPEQGTQRQVGSRFQQQATQAEARPEFVWPEDLAAARNRQPVRVNDAEMGRKLVTSFESPVDEALYRMTVAENTKQTGAAKRLRELLKAQTGLTADQITERAFQVRRAVSQAMSTVKADPNATRMTVKRVQFAAEAPKYTDEQRAALKAQDEARRAEAEAQRAAEQQRLAAEAAQREAEQAAREDAEIETLKQRFGAEELTREADRLERFGADVEKVGFAQRNEAGTTKADIAALRAAAAGKPLEASQRARVLDYLRTVDGMVRQQAAQVPEAGTQRTPEFQGLEDIYSERPDVIDDAIEPDTDAPAAERPGDLPFSVGRRRERRSLTDSPELRAVRDTETWRQIQLAPQKEMEWRAEGDAMLARDAAGTLARLASGQIKQGSGAEAWAVDRLVAANGPAMANDPALFEQVTRAVAHLDRNLSMAGLMMRSAQTDRFGRLSPAGVRDTLWRMAAKPSAKTAKQVTSADPKEAEAGMARARKEFAEVQEEWKRMGVLIPVGGESAADGSSNFVETQGGGPNVTAAPADGSGRPGQETPAQGIQGAPGSANAARPPEVAPVVQYDFAPEILRDPQRAASALRAVATTRADWADIVNEIVRNNFLGDPKGQLRNGLGSAVTVGKRMTAEWATQAMMNSIRAATGKAPLPNSVEWRTMQHAYENILPIVGRAGRNLAKAWSTEVSAFQDTFMDSGPNVAIKGKLGRVVRYRQRLNLAVDEFFMTVATELGIRERAMRFARVEGAQNGWTDAQVAARAEQLAIQPPEPIKLAALDEARELTLKADPGWLGNALLRVKSSHDSSPLARVLLNVLFPFVKTPVNALKFGVKAVPPIGLMRMGVKALQGKYKGADSAFAKDTAEQIVGMALTGAIAGLMMPDDEGRPRITGSPANVRDPGRRDFQGNLIPPKSIRVGDKWVSYAGLEPLATTLQLAADSLDVALNAKDYGGWGKAFNKIGGLMTSVLKDRTYLQQVDSIMQTIDGDMAAEDLLGRMVTGAVVPGEVRAVSRALDPAVRQRWTEGGGPIEGVPFSTKLDYMIAPTPGNAAAPRLDMWGTPRAKDETSVFKTGMGDTLFRLFNPADVRQAKSLNNYERMLWNYYRNRPLEKMPGQPEDTFTWQGAKYRMTPEEYQNYARVRGAMIQQRAARQRWNFDHPSAGDDIKRFRDIIESSARDARDMVIRMRLKSDPDAMIREMRSQRAKQAVRV